MDTFFNVFLLIQDDLSESFDLPEIDFDGKISVEAKFANNDLTENVKIKDEIIEEQKNKIIHLEKKIKELINNEENENKTLEMVVQQVEKNLLKTTERAVKSEKNCEALNNELNELKLKLKILSQENLILKKNLLNNNQDIMDSINDIVFKLNNASDTAEKSLNSLLGGVGSLRLIANILESLGKIKETI